MNIVGNAKKHAKQLAGTEPKKADKRRKLPIELPVGVVESTFIEHLSDKLERVGGMHSIAATMTETAQPDQRTEKKWIRTIHFTTIIMKLYCGAKIVFLEAKTKKLGHESTKRAEIFGTLHSFRLICIFEYVQSL